MYSTYHNTQRHSVREKLERRFGLFFVFFSQFVSLYDLVTRQSWHTLNRKIFL